MTVNWRAAIVYTHRWLGIGGCLLFVLWFVSGVIMMYARMPSLSGEERLARASRLDLSTARVEPAQATAAAGFAASAIRLGMLGTRPVYRLNAGRAWALVYADTGDALSALTAEQALTVARAFAPGQTKTITEIAYLTDSDQWTLSSAIRPLMPLRRFSLGDAAGTELYVSDRTAEPVMKTTRRARVWGYLGAVLHWLYFTPLRRHTDVWAHAIIWLSIAGSVMCLSGLVWGLWRISPSARFRLKRESSHSPYAGMMRWHHYAGLVFGLTTFTWIFSGLMSMTPWDWSPGNAPTRPQREAVTGGPLRTAEFTLDRIRRGLAVFTAAGIMPKELAVSQFQGEPFLLAFTPAADRGASVWSNTDLPAFLEAPAVRRRYVSLKAPERGMVTGFNRDTLMAVAQTAVPGARTVESTWLDAYDAYYYDRSGDLSLPVLRTRYDDANATWLYFDPSQGAVVQKEERRSRLERWLYHGLHSLDFPFLYYRRPLWDIVLMLLSIGGIVSSVTTLAPAWHRLRRHGRRLFRLR